MKPVPTECQTACSMNNMKPILITLVLVAAIIGGGYWVHTSGMIHPQMQPATTMMHDVPKNDAPMKHDDMMMGTGEWTKEEMEAMEKDHMMMSGSMNDAQMDDKKIIPHDDMMKMDTSVMTKSTGYLTYDAALVDDALKSGQKVVLFFHATWCPSCGALDKAISADTIPTDTLIMKVDYDSNEALKKQYQITSQHTTVILNADGSEKSKKLGARNMNEVLQ